MATALSKSAVKCCCGFPVGYIEIDHVVVANVMGRSTLRLVLWRTFWAHRLGNDVVVIVLDRLGHATPVSEIGDVGDRRSEMWEIGDRRCRRSEIGDVQDRKCA